MAKTAKKPGGKFRGLGAFFIILGVLFALPALLLSVSGGALTARSFGYKHEMTALPTFESLTEDTYYTADLGGLIKFADGIQAVGVGDYTVPTEFYYINAHDLSNNSRLLVVQGYMPETVASAKSIDSANRDGITIPDGLTLKITGVLGPLPEEQKNALYTLMIDSGVAADEAAFSEMVLPYMLVEMPVDYALYVAVGGIVILLIAVLFFILAGVMFRKSRKLVEAAEVEAAKKMDFTKIKQPDSEKFFSNEDDIDSLVSETPSFAKKPDKKSDLKDSDDGAYKPKVPVPAPEAAPDDLDLSNLDFSSLKPPEEAEDPLF
jgi:hypothetical protein